MDKMKNLIFIFVLTLNWFCTGDHSNKYTISDSTFQFEIKLPCSGKIKLDTTAVNKFIQYECSDGHSKYKVICTEYSDGLYHSDSLNNIEFDLDYTQKKFASTEHVKSTSTLLKTINGYPGKEFRFEHFEKDIIYFRRVYIVKNRVYELLYEAPKEKAFNTEIDDYYNSFRLVGIPDNEKPYLNLPPNEEIQNRPFDINFFGKTELSVEYQENFLGKIPIVTEGNQIKDEDRSGILALIVFYGILPEGTTETQKDRLIREQMDLITNKGQIINEKNIEGGKEISITYTVATVPIIDKRRLIFKGNKYYNVCAMYLKEKPESKRVNEFMDSFHIK